MTNNTQNEKREPQELVIPRGLSGSGKTTWAKKWVAANPSARVRINRDDLRKMVYGAYWFGGDPGMENTITKIQHEAVRAALRARKSVVVDDTNLRQSVVAAFLNIAREFEGRVQVRIQDFEVKIDTAVERDNLRKAAGDRFVGDEVIRNQSQRYMNGGDRLPKLPAEFYEQIVPGVGPKYEEDKNLPGAWLVDIDGTIARMVGRSPYDWHRVDEDEPIEHVIELVRDLKDAGHIIVVMSGRDGSCEKQTRDWLDVYEVPYDHLFMRTADDMRKDNIVKHELFEAHIRGRFYVNGILDDRDQVIKMWREKGLFVAQVAYGAF